METKVIITGAGGQIGTELTAALRGRHGADNVIATDIRSMGDTTGEFRLLDVMDAIALRSLVQSTGATEIYHLAAYLSASGEKQPQRAWELNMRGLLNVLEVAREFGCRVFWPSSIAVFGDHVNKALCQQDSVTQPATVYGISKAAGENWCRYYYHTYGVDVRSLRYPGLISHTAMPGGGTTDYAVDIFHYAVRGADYTCFLDGNTVLPMMYMPDAVEGTIRLMETPAERLNIRTSYNFAAFSFSPFELAEAIRKQLPGFRMVCESDFRQAIADSWPQRIDDHRARLDWGWQQRYSLDGMVSDMLVHLAKR